ncbi:MAG: hypothetical protein QXJ24_03965, partial [Thermoplasmatales archaeon]
MGPNDLFRGFSLYLKNVDVVTSRLSSLEVSNRASPPFIAILAAKDLGINAMFLSIRLLPL